MAVYGEWKWDEPMNEERRTPTWEDVRSIVAAFS
jgi:hypothetical protein